MSEADSPFPVPVRWWLYLLSCCGFAIGLIRGQAGGERVFSLAVCRYQLGRNIAKPLQNSRS